MVQRVDGREKVTGRARYAADISLDRMLIALPLHAPHPHARITGIDTTAARALPGVAAVITAADLPAAGRVGGIIHDHYLLVSDKTRYQGDVLALVAAETRAAAVAALDAIQVEIEPLPLLTDPDAALSSSAPRIHPERADNLIAGYRLRHGDAQAALENCARVLQREYRTGRVEHAYLEPEACVAVPESDRSISVYGSMQNPFSTRRFVALATGLPLNRTRIIQTTLGGAFGGKDDTISMICARAAVLALHTGRPVKMVYTREESMRESYKRHPYRVRLRLGLSGGGRLAALESDILADGGAYCTTSPFVIWRPTAQCAGPYLIPAVSCDSRAVYTNNPLTGAMRGFGSPQYNFALESLIDEAAHESGIDPATFRRDNFFSQGDTIHTGEKLDGHVVSIRQVLDAALERFGWAEKQSRATQGIPNAHGHYYGVGLACCYRGVSLGAESADFCSAELQIERDGSVSLRVGVNENGQGLKTAMVHIAATELGIDHERIRFLESDTSQISDGGPTVASRGTLAGGNAVIDAIRQLKIMMRPVIANRIGPGAITDAPRPPHVAGAVTDAPRPAHTLADEYSWRAGKVTNPGTGAALSFEDLAAECYSLRLNLRAIGSWSGPHVSWDDTSGQGKAYFTYVYSCNLAEVEVDARNCAIRVLRLLGAHDIGRAVNHQAALGQIYGGLVMGMGYALTEKYDVRDAIGIPSNLDRYHIPRIDEVPELDALIIENADPAGPWGAKSLGEPATEIVAPAIANAIFSATGVRLRELPLTPQAIARELSCRTP